MRKQNLNGYVKWSQLLAVTGIVLGFLILTIAIFTLQLGDTGWAILGHFVAMVLGAAAVILGFDALISDL